MCNLALAQSDEELCELEQTGIQQSDDHAADHDNGQNNTGIGDDSLLCRPCDILELDLQVAEPFADLLESIRLALFLLAIGFLSLLCAFGILRSLGDF